MGRIKSSICQECLDEQDYFFGVGQSSTIIHMNLLTGDLSWIREQVSASTFEKLKILINKTENMQSDLSRLQFNFEAKLFQCDACNIVESHNDILICQGCLFEH